MKTTWIAGLLTATAALGGCVAVPVATVGPPLQQQQQQQQPFVAVPGPGKTEAVFRRDDAFCRTAPASNAQRSTAPGVPPGSPPVTGEMTPGVAYLQCMEARNNTIQPLASSAPPPVYTYVQAYPVYAGPWYGYGYPWYYGSVGFGFYGGYRGGFGGYGYRGHGGYGGYGGYRDGGYRGGYGGRR